MKLKIWRGDIMSTEMLDQPVSKFTNPNVPKIDSNMTVAEAANEMLKDKSDSILVVTNYNVIGIVTQKDILSEVVAKGKDPTKTSINEIASKPIIKIHENNKVREAIELMKKHDIRRLIVVNNDLPIGLISQKALVGNMTEYDITLPELEIPNKVMCPYCLSLFMHKEALSNHIDNKHAGRVLLEGNLAKIQNNIN